MAERDMEIDPSDNTKLLFENGDVQRVETVNRIKQQIIIGLQILKGGWVLDYTQGVAYITGLRGSYDVLKAQIKNAILTTKGVESVKNYRFTPLQDRTIEVSATVIVDNNEFTFTTKVGI